MTDFGTDISAFPDLAPYFGLVSGLDSFSQALVRRLSTPRGGLFYDPEYGLDLRQYVNEGLTDEVLFEIESRVTGEVEQDERVLRAEVTATPLDLRRLQVELILETQPGPFRLVLGVSQVSVEVLYADAGGIVAT